MICTVFTTLPDISFVTCFGSFFTTWDWRWMLQLLLVVSTAVTLAWIVKSCVFLTVIQQKSKPKSCYNWRSVSMSWCQVHSGTCDQIFSVWKLLCCLCEEPSLTRGRASPCHQCLVHCQRFNIIYIVHVTCFEYMQYILDLCQHGLSTADHPKIDATTAI
jgi:hypothetical protein